MHNINKMVYVGQEPWHGLGVQLPANGTYDDIAVAAGFYSVQERELIVAGAADQLVPDKKALIRSDDGRYLSTVGLGYTVLQFEEMARTVVAAAGEVRAVFTTAGTLGPTGVRGWLLGELPGPITVQGDPSPLRKYVLAYSGHDGCTSLVLKNCCTRVVCQNTLGVALGEREGAEWRIQHTTNARVRLAEAGTAFRALAKSYDRFGEMANLMARSRLSEIEMRGALDMVLPVPKDDRNHDRIIRDRDTILRLFETGLGIEGGMRGTAWAALQAFSEWSDHHRQVRASGNDLRSARLESIWLGKAASLKHAAMSAIMQTIPAARA